MKWPTFLTVCLLSAVVPSHRTYPQRGRIPWPLQRYNQELEFVFNYTWQLHKRHRFNTIAIFRSEHIKDTRPQYIMVNSLEQAIMQEFGTPLFVRSTDAIVPFRKYLGLNSFVIVFIAHREDPILEVVAKSLEGLHFMSILVLYKGRDNLPPSLEEITKFFKWCWYHNMVNMAITFKVVQLWEDKESGGVAANVRNEIFSYTPYPAMEILNLTVDVHERGVDFMTHDLKDTQGYVIRTPIFQNPPIVFLTPFERHHKNDYKLFITGTAGRLYHEFAHYVNASIKLTIQSNISFYLYHKKTLLLAARKVIDIGVHPFSGLLPYAQLTDGTYPIGYTNACVIVPLVAEIDRSEYLIRTLQPLVWLALLLELVSLFVVQSLHLQCLGVGESILYGVGTLLMQPLDVKEFENRKPALRFMHLLVIMANVWLNSLFCACLTSLLSTTIEGDQIVTAADLIRSGLPLMINPYEKEIFFDKHLLPETLKPCLRVVNETWLDFHKNSLNTNYAYVATAQEWQKLNYQQQLLRKPLFRIASDEFMCTANYFLRFPVQWDSPFQQMWLKYYLMVSETGLDRVWEDRSFYHATKLNLLSKRMDNTPNDIDFEFQYLSKAFALHGCFLALAVCCFVMELLCAKRANTLNRTMR